MKLPIALAAVAILAAAASTPVAGAKSGGQTPLLSPKPLQSLAYGGSYPKMTCLKRVYKRCLHDRREPYRIRVVKCRRIAARQCGGIVHPG